MAQFIQMICPNCGGDLIKVDGDMYRCENCHVYHKIDNRNLHHDLLDVAAIRESLNFKLAEQKCRKLLQEYASADLTDVYWNLLLCEQRVVFETDQKGAQFPSFYDIVPTDIESSENYKKCNEYLNRFNSQNAYNYEELVDKMVSAKRKYRRIRESSKPFDIFICFKKSRSESEGGGETRDYKIAYQLYNVFCKSYNVFFSEETLFNIGGVTEYEPHIYHALYTAKIMFLICSKREYLESQWVKNEWSRFKRMADNAQQTKVIIPIFVDDFTPEYLPDDIKSCQGLNNDMYLIDRLKTSVNNFLHPVDKEAELNAKIEAEVQRRLKTVNIQPVSKPIAQQVTTTLKPTAPQPQPTTKVGVAPDYIVPYGTKKIKEVEFENRTRIKTAIIPDTVTSIEDGAFRGCTELKSVTIPNSVKKIGDCAFSNCVALTSVKIPDSVETIGDWAFHYCPSLTDITIPGETHLGACVFYDCKGLKNVTIGDGATNIAYNTFYGCNELKNVNIPKSVKSIDEGAFSGCRSLQVFWISGNVTNIGSNAFWDCRQLAAIIFEGTVKQWNNISKGRDWDKNTYLSFVTCSDGKIDMSLIYELHGDTYTVVGDKRRTLFTLEIPNENGNIPVTAISNKAFYNHSGFSSVTIPESITSIGDSAFYGCSNLKTVNFNATDCSNMGESVFGNCGKLDTVNIGNNVTNIPVYAFKGCTGLTSVTIPDSVKSICGEAFGGCTGIKSVTIGSGIETIGSYVFKGCSALTDITYNGTTEQWKNLIKAKYWNDGTGKYVVHCTDGDLKKSIFNKNI